MQFGYNSEIYCHFSIFSAQLQWFGKDCDLGCNEWMCFGFWFTSFIFCAFSYMASLCNIFLTVEWPYHTSAYQSVAMKWSCMRSYMQLLVLLVLHIAYTRHHTRGLYIKGIFSKPDIFFSVLHANNITNVTSTE